jgi:hypothetical protein
MLGAELIDLNLLPALSALLSREFERRQHAKPLYFHPSTSVELADLKQTKLRIRPHLL